MIIIAHLIGICFFGAIAASGFILTTQVLYWIGVAAMLFIAMGNYFNAKNNMKLLSEKKPLDEDLAKILPILLEMNFDIKCVHTLFANVIHAVIALQLLHAPILGAAIMLAALANIVTMQQLKELMNHVKDDTRYQ